MEAEAVVNGVKVALKSYHHCYNKSPKSLEDLLKRNNRREIEFFEDDEIPIDPFSKAKSEIHLITGVRAVVFNSDKEGFSRIIYGGESMIVYSVGENGIDNGGICDENRDADDIAVLVTYKKEL